VPRRKLHCGHVIGWLYHRLVVYRLQSAQSALWDRCNQRQWNMVYDLGAELADRYTTPCTQSHQRSVETSIYQANHVHFHLLTTWGRNRRLYCSTRAQLDVHTCRSWFFDLDTLTLKSSHASSWFQSHDVNAPLW